MVYNRVMSNALNIQNLVVKGGVVMFTEGWTVPQLAENRCAGMNTLASVQHAEVEYSKDGKKARILSMPSNMELYKNMVRVVDRDEFIKSRTYANVFSLAYTAQGTCRVHGKTAVYEVDFKAQTCTCPHFEYRLAGSGARCSHIHFVNSQNKLR